MFTREQYPKILSDLNLSSKQKAGLRSVLEQMMTYAKRTAEKADNVGDDSDNQYYCGKVDGLNAIDRFLRGDMDAHDEFED